MWVCTQASLPSPLQPDRPHHIPFCGSRGVSVALSKQGPHNHTAEVHEWLPGATRRLCSTCHGSPEHLGNVFPSARLQQIMFEQSHHQSHVS